MAAAIAQAGSTDADAIIDSLASDSAPLMRYTAMRLALPLIGNRITPEKALEIAAAEIETKNPLTLSLATMLRSEAEFFLEEPD